MDNTNNPTPESTPPTDPNQVTPVIETDPNTSPPAAADAPPSTNNIPITKPKKSNAVLKLNRYIILFVVLLLIGVGLTLFVTISNQQSTISIDGVELSEDALASLGSQQTQVDTREQLLTIAPDTEFNGRVTVKDTVEIIGDLVVSGTIVTADNPDEDTPLQSSIIEGDFEIQGSLGVVNINASGNVSVGGDMAVAGDLVASSITTSQLNFNGNFSISGHLISNSGSTSASSGGALGAGGTSSISGNDTAGVISINTGSGPGAGTLISVNFRQGYGRAPKVLLTPTTSAAAQTEYYVTRTTAGFTVRSATTPPAGSNLQFDYFVIE